MILAILFSAFYHLRFSKSSLSLSRILFTISTMMITTIAAGIKPNKMEIKMPVNMQCKN